MTTSQDMKTTVTSLLTCCLCIIGYLSSVIYIPGNFIANPGNTCIRAHGVVGYHARLARSLREVLGSIPNVSISPDGIFAVTECPKRTHNQAAFSFSFFREAPTMAMCVRYHFRSV